MNLIGEIADPTSAKQESVDDKYRVTHILTVVLFPVVAILAYSVSTVQLPFLLLALISMVAYFATIYLYFGIAELAFDRRTRLLWSSAVGSFVLGFVISGLTNFWPLLTGCSMILSGGIITGRMMADGKSVGHIYLLAGLAVAMFFVAQFSSIWGPTMQKMTDDLPAILTQMESLYGSIGVGADVAQDALAQSEKMFLAITRVVPAITVLGTLTQFSIGFLVFSFLMRRRYPLKNLWIPFNNWRVPFAFSPLLIVAIVGRLIGNEALQLIADNVLVILAVYYSIAGLALIEYYMSKLSLPPLLRVSFYVMLFLTQLLSILAAVTLFVVLILLGFADSFADWRNKEPEKTQAA